MTDSDIIGILFCLLFVTIALIVKDLVEPKKDDDNDYDDDF